MKLSIFPDLTSLIASDLFVVVLAFTTLINARFNEGYTKEDFIKVIDIKTNEWLKTKMEQYLRPETLFSNKFEGYLNQSSCSPSWLNQEIEAEKSKVEITEEDLKYVGINE